VRSRLIALTSFLALSCTTSQVDLDEPRRVVGTADQVRIDAMITGESIDSGTQLPITWEITNHRSVPVAVADLIPETSFDRESGLITVTLGAELPGEALLPRLIEIPPGESKTFRTSARINFQRPRPGGMISPSRAELRLKLNFLSDTTPFRQLIGIDERAVADPALADALFPVWIEKNEVIVTNSLPLRWKQEVQLAPAPVRRRRF
jgi:hypothetical protein